MEDVFFIILCCLSDSISRRTGRATLFIPLLFFVSILLFHHCHDNEEFIWTPNILVKLLVESGILIWTKGTKFR